MSSPPQVGIAFLLSQVGSHTAILFANALTKLELRPYDAGILRMLGTNPGLCQRALCDLFGVFPSRLVALLDDLETKKLIERRPDSRDRRRFILHLTKLGCEALAQIEEITEVLEDDIFIELSSNERAQLHSFLTRVTSQQKIVAGVHPAYRALGDAKKKAGSANRRRK